MMPRGLIALALLFVPLSHGQAPVAIQGIASDAHRAAEAITVAELREYLSFIAHDSLAGRATPSRGLDLTAAYIVKHLRGWGVRQPAGLGGYLQPIALNLTSPDSAAVHAEYLGKRYPYMSSFRAYADGRTYVGPMVYVGHGFRNLPLGVDPYQGVDVRGKFVAVSLAPSTLPKALVGRSVVGLRRGVDYDRPEDAARRLGAIGVLWMPNSAMMAEWKQEVRYPGSRGYPSAPRLSSESKTKDEIFTDEIELSAELTDALFAGERHEGPELRRRGEANDQAESFELNPGKVVRFDLRAKTIVDSTANVVAVIEGRDPNLRHEYVVIGAHYDHLPMDTRFEGDSVYNGADDNGSGVVALMAIARALQQGPRPRRSIAIVWFTGEDSAPHIGSTYFVEFPVIPLDRVVTYFNLDMIGRSRASGDSSRLSARLTGAHEINVIGPRLMSTDLSAVVDEVNRGYLGLTLKYPGDVPPYYHMTGSDHIQFARKGIPTVFYESGLHVDYHRPSDTADKIDYAKVASVARTALVTAWTVAERRERPRVDKVLPAELRSR
jgi:hypothetical protein